eukprot:6185319-Pleurochrysis_carterae.AAC.2
MLSISSPRATHTIEPSPTQLADLIRESAHSPTPPIHDTYPSTYLRSQIPGYQRKRTHARASIFPRTLLATALAAASAGVGWASCTVAAEGDDVVGAPDGREQRAVEPDAHAADDHVAALLAPHKDAAVLRPRDHEPGRRKLAYSG